MKTVGSLKDGQLFVTGLTGRTGVVLRKEDKEVVVLFYNGTEKAIHPGVLVLPCGN